MSRYKKILIPTDFTEGSETALEHALDFEANEICLVNVVQEIQVPYGIDVANIGFSDFEKEVITANTKRLKKISDELASKGVNCSYWILVGTASNEIIKFANEKECDLIVMPTHGSSGLEHFIFGSTTEKVLRKSKTPVLVVRLNNK